MSMGLAMLVKVALGFEGKATGYTRIWPFSSMRADVLLQDTGLCACSTTVVTYVLTRLFWFLLFFAVALLSRLRA